MTNEEMRAFFVGLDDLPAGERVALKRAAGIMLDQASAGRRCGRHFRRPAAESLPMSAPRRQALGGRSGVRGGLPPLSLGSGDV